MREQPRGDPAGPCVKPQQQPVSKKAILIKMVQTRAALSNFAKFPTSNPKTPQITLYSKPTRSKPKLKPPKRLNHT